MKKIFVSFLISISFFSYADAAILVPSLTAQIIRQEKINKKNDYSSRVVEQARIRQETIDRAIELKKQRIVKRNVNKVVTSSQLVTPQLVTPQFVVPNSNLVIKHPPEITPIKVNPTPVLNTNIPIAPNVDISRVRSTWISWYNNIRQAE